ncbi:MAG TPA: DUF2269 family protein [Chitinophagales bacterium]|jgi:uncharacterized membrane protein|nr:DUF2269 family protein [Chitinophagales bacterium]MBP6153309.1 DUF2269 family protein [Chitinophagales bacterium]HQV78431.1 DUF2269 family protein [Chitinophagales bacterium]HQW78883.1 DUF2269 family protein [Chitinophagales bacterium]HRB19048.1 DUF2269 family protein [Chitinophagales bacterium]
MLPEIYHAILLIHVLSAILGLGPGFVMIYVVTRAQTMTELRHAYLIRNRLHVFVMVGGTLLLLTGLLMGFLNRYLLSQEWYVISLSLFLIALAFGPLLLSPKSKPIKKLLQEHKSDIIPDEYYRLAKKLFFYERIENLIFIAIIILMILKPNF